MNVLVVACAWAAPEKPRHRAEPIAKNAYAGDLNEGSQLTESRGCAASPLLLLRGPPLCIPKISRDQLSSRRPFFPSHLPGQDGIERMDFEPLRSFAGYLDVSQALTD